MSEKSNSMLRKAEIALASTYQAAGVLIFHEADKEPSEQDQIELLNLLSRWQDMSEQEIEDFLPWPKNWKTK